MTPTNVGHAEPLMLELVLARRHRLTVVVDEDEAVVRNHFQEPFEALDGAPTQQETLCRAASVIDDEFAVRDLARIDGAIIIFRREQAIHFKQFLHVLRRFRLGPLLELVHGHVGEVVELDVASHAGPMIVHSI